MVDRWPTTVGEMTDLSPGEFEHFVAELYEAQGYDTKKIQLRSDRGRDVVADRDAERVVIQAKRNAPTNRVGSEDIQQYGTILHEDDVDAVEIVTTSSFTNPGYRTASRIEDLHLVDGGRLEDWASKYEPQPDTRTSESDPSVSPELGIPSFPSTRAGLAWLLSPDDRDRWRNLIVLIEFVAIVSLLSVVIVPMPIEIENAVFVGGFMIAWFGHPLVIYKDLKIAGQKMKLFRGWPLIAFFFPVLSVPFYLKSRPPLS